MQAKFVLLDPEKRGQIRGLGFGATPTNTIGYLFQNDTSVAIGGNKFAKKNELFRIAPGVHVMQLEQQ